MASGETDNSPRLGEPTNVYIGDSHQIPSREGRHGCGK